MKNTAIQKAVNVCFINDFTPVMKLNIDGMFVSIDYQEMKWVELNRTNFTVTVTGEFPADEMFTDQSEFNSLKEKIAARFLQKSVEEFADMILQADCTYECSGVADGSIIHIEYEGVCLEDGWVTDYPFYASYPKITVTSGKVTLKKAIGKNIKEVVRQYKRLGLFSDLGLGFFEMLLFYPIRGVYYKHLCKPHVLKKNILYYEAHKNDPKKRKKKRHYLLFLILFLLVGLLFTEFINPMIFIEKEMPALVSSDYTSIVFLGDTYEKTDGLPADAAEEKVLGVEKWYGARLDGLSRFDQSLSTDKVKVYTDKDGNKYLWLVRDYLDSIHDENGDDKEYGDFENPEVYICRNPE